MTPHDNVPAILERLIAFESISTSSNLDIIGFAKAWLESCGFRTHLLPDATGTKAGLVAQIGPDKPGGLVLSAHTDVVPVEGQNWSHNPFKLEKRGNRFFGRGTADMKGFIACVLALASTCPRKAFKHPLTIVLSYDEERGCLGIRQMVPHLPALLGQPRLCIVGEPTNMGVAVGHKGKVVWQAICRGQTGHSAMAPNYCNALHLAADLVTIIRNEQQTLKQSGARDDDYLIPYSTLHVGSVRGGGPVNMVPAEAYVEFEFRHLPADTPDVVLNKIQFAMKNAVECMQHEAAGCKTTEINAYPGLHIDPSHDAVKCVQALTSNQRISKVDYGTEAGFFAAMGIPTLVCGPGNMAQGHQPDEFIESDELFACSKFLKLLIEQTQKS